MDAERLGAAFALLAGALTLIVWAIYGVTGTLLGETLHDMGLAFHVAAEIATAVVLLVGGAMTLRGAPRARAVLMVGLGMLLYAAVNALGFYEGWWNQSLLVAALLGTLAVLGLLLWAEPRAA